MSGSLFNPDIFLETEVQGQMDDKVVPFPLGRYKFQIDEVKLVRGDRDAKDLKPGDEPYWYSLELLCKADGNQPARGEGGKTIGQITGRDSLIARYKAFADLKNGAWELGPGKNVGLGAIRTAVGLNDPSQPFKLGMLKGQVFSGEIVHKKDKNDPEKFYPEIRNPIPLDQHMPEEV
jgi:hypothetical protein